MNDNFAVFILSHGRAKNCATLKSLRKCGYKGQWYIVIDTEDEQAELYRKNYGESHIKVFDKADYMDRFDAFDNFRSKAAVIFARYASQDMAAEMGLEYYAQMDDDISGFYLRYKDGKSLRGKKPKNIDRYFEALNKFLDVSGFYILALGTQAQLIGGLNERFKRGLVWMGSNVFFLRTDRKIKWCCSVNEDICTAIRMAQSGGIAMSIMSITINTPPVAAAGGMQGAYSDGKYYHNYARIMLAPNGCHLSKSGVAVTETNKVFPKIINEKWRKCT